MSNEANSDQGGSGRKRRRRRGRNRRSKNNGNNQGGNKGNQRNGNRSRNKRKPRTPEDKFGGRDPRDVSAGEHEVPTHLNAFELFCSYHLGIFERNEYRQPSIKSVARLFERSPEEIREALSACGLDDQSVRQANFDLSLAQLDVRVAPEGIDKREIAKGLFEEFVDAHPGFVDWSEERAD